MPTLIGYSVPSTSTSTQATASSFCSSHSNWTHYNDSGASAGTMSNPYSICTAAQLVDIANNTSSYASSFKLMGDIDLASYYVSGGTEFQIGTSSNPFTGSFDGGGHTMAGFKQTTITTDSTCYGGLFGLLDQSASISNLSMTGANISGGATCNSAGIGILVGSINATSETIENVSVAGSIQVALGSATGGMIGSMTPGNSGNGLVFTSISSNVSLSGDSATVGGLIGISNNSSISIVNATSAGSITLIDSQGGGFGGVGGLIGQSYTAGTISNSSSSMSINLTSNSPNNTSSQIGGLMGLSIMTIDNCYATGSVTISGTSSFSEIGGLVGQVQCQAGSVITHSYATGAITLLDATNVASIGGLAGLDESMMNSFNYATGNIVSAGNAEYVGGLYGLGGLCSEDADNSYATGNITLTGTGTSASYIGGLVGFQVTGVHSSHATGSIEVNDLASDQQGPVGGLIGSAENIVSESYATGSITSVGDLTQAGGLVGQASNTIENSYATGSISITGGDYGTYSVGGLAGEGKSVTSSYATGSITLNPSSGCTGIGGLVGQLDNSASMVTSYASGAVSGCDQMGGLVGINQGSITNSLSVGAVTGDATYDDGTVGLLVGDNSSGTVTTSYYYSGVTCTNPYACNTVGTADAVHSDFELSNSPVLMGWDFTSTWTAVSNGLPILLY
jgi:hypothetical protein